MRSRQLGNSDKKTYKNVPLEINLATMEGEKDVFCPQITSQFGT